MGAGGEPILERAASHFPRLRPSSGRGSPVHCPTGGGEPLAEWRGKWNVALWRLHSLSHGTQLAAPPHRPLIQGSGSWSDLGYSCVVAVLCRTVVLLFGLTSPRGYREPETNADHFFHPSLIYAVQFQFVSKRQCEHHDFSPVATYSRSAFM